MFNYEGYGRGKNRERHVVLPEGRRSFEGKLSEETK
jgi:hypothetical protein